VTFFAAVKQLETLVTELDLNWPEEVKAEAQRRLNRVARAVRTAPKTRAGIKPGR
jgi:hypothetical protein